MLIVKVSTGRSISLILMIDWFGVIAKKYENMMSIPPM